MLFLKFAFLLICWNISTFQLLKHRVITHTQPKSHTPGSGQVSWPLMVNPALTQFGFVSMIFFYTCLSSSYKPQRPTQRHIKEANGCVRASKARIPKKKPCLFRPIHAISLQFSHLCHLKKKKIQLHCIITIFVLIFCSLVGQSHRIQLQVTFFVLQYYDTFENRY